MTLSKDGNPEIYLLSLATGALQRITNNPAIDTEAAWAPDGQAIVFTSDRGGSPQLYRVAPGGGPAERLTFEGSYNARASFSLSGRALALVHRTAGRFRIAALDLETGALRVLSDGALDESPSVAPNGSLVIYATRSGGRGILAAVSMDGQVHQRLVATEGEVREPAWSPFTHN
jgi:TolB protein